jgi:hypothetical protein
MGEARSLRETVDHLLLGVPDLDAGITWFRERTGVEPQIGGSHPGMGTRNALVSLGGRQYLEIIAPDPAQSAFNFNIDLRKLPGPRLVTWAAWTPNVDAAVASARHAGLEVFGPREGSRVRPDGTTLRWRSAGVMAGFAGPEIDPVPFFIQWAAESRHPSSDAPKGCHLIEFEIAAPDPDKLEAALANLGINAKVARAAETRLTATLDTPSGRVNIY